MKSLLALVAFVLSTLPPASAAAHDHPSVHGMLVLGKDRVYLSHLPMFHRPHDYQMIAEAKLPPAARAAYLKDRETHPDQDVYTLVPEAFSLPAMAAQPRPFKADLYRGHFERGGVPILEGITVTFAQVIHFRKFDPAARHPATLTYLAFGQPGGETFLAHLVTARPDFDHVLEAPGLGGALPRQVEFAGVDPESPLPSGFRQLYLETGDLE